MIACTREAQRTELGVAPFANCATRAIDDVVTSDPYRGQNYQDATRKVAKAFPDPTGKVTNAFPDPTDNPKQAAVSELSCRGEELRCRMCK